MAVFVISILGGILIALVEVCILPWIPLLHVVTLRGIVTVMIIAAASRKSTAMAFACAAAIVADITQGTPIGTRVFLVLGAFAILSLVASTSAAPHTFRFIVWISMLFTITHRLIEPILLTSVSPHAVPWGSLLCLFIVNVSIAIAAGGIIHARRRSLPVP